MIFASPLGFLRRLVSDTLILGHIPLRMVIGAAVNTPVITAVSHRLDKNDYSLSMLCVFPLLLFPLKFPLVSAPFDVVSARSVLNRTKGGRVQHMIESCF